MVGVSPDISRVKILALTENLANGAGALLGAQTPLLPGLLHATDDYVGPGYGVQSDASEEATAVLGPHRRCSTRPRLYGQDGRGHAGLGPKWPHTTGRRMVSLAHRRIPHGLGTLKKEAAGVLDATTTSSPHIVSASQDDPDAF